MSIINARSHVLEMIQNAANKAAEKDVEVRVEYNEFTSDGKVEATITATPKKEPR